MQIFTEERFLITNRKPSLLFGILFFASCMSNATINNILIKTTINHKPSHLITITKCLQLTTLSGIFWSSAPEMLRMKGQGGRKDRRLNYV